MNSGTTSLCEHNLQALERSMELAFNHEWPQIDATRHRLTDLVRMPITTDHPSHHVVATVATDGGENRLFLEPVRIQIMRVRDSEGKTYFQDFIPLSLKPEEIIRFFFQGNELIQRVLTDTGLTSEVLLPRHEYERSGLLSMLRELMEWGSLISLASSPRQTPAVIIRDGLLRSVNLNQQLFTALGQILEERCSQTGNMVVGVAKRSVVMNYLSLVIALDDVLPINEAGYVAIDPEIEKEAAPNTYRWAGPRSMGQLMLARLCPRSSAIFPVEIPDWLSHHTPAIMQSLACDAASGFPIRGYPASLTRAHEFARIGGLEMRIIERLFLTVIRKRDPALAREVASQALLGRRMSAGPDSEVAR